MWDIIVNQKENLKLSHDNGWEVNGKHYNIDLQKISGDSYHLLIENRSYDVTVLETDHQTKSFKIKIGNNIYDLEVKDKFDQLLEQMGLNDPVDSSIKEIKAPMPGLVLNVMVKVGNELKKDETVLILEAMKMENVLKSPSNGMIKKINIVNKERSPKTN